MTPDTYLLIWGAILAGPFLVACIKGKPHIGLVGGFISFMLMAFLIIMGVSKLVVLLGGVLVAGMTLCYTFDDD